MVRVLIDCTAALLLLYCLLLLFYTYWFYKLKEEKIAAVQGSRCYFSIIIPARDEAANIAACLHSILQNTYPADLYEILVIDDHSEDQTAAIVENYTRRYANVHLLCMAELLPRSAQLNSYKKKAIELAIARAKGNWILTTDADCTVGPQWLESLDNYIGIHQPELVAAPVRFSNNGTFLGIFQCLDFLSLQGITAASVAAGVLSMCNGANLCYRKAAFLSVGGYSQVDKLASGDDMFLMYKIQKAFPGKTGYLFSSGAIVSTLPMADLKQFINQRIRWASKAGTYQDKRITLVLALVYLLNLLLLLVFCMAFLNGTLWLPLFVMILVKTGVEMLFMVPVARFYKQGALLKWFPLMEPFHIVYTVMSGLLGKCGKYQWKGRRVH